MLAWDTEGRRIDAVTHVDESGRDDDACAELLQGDEDDVHLAGEESGEKDGRKHAYSG